MQSIYSLTFIALVVAILGVACDAKHVSSVGHLNQGTSSWFRSISSIRGGAGKFRQNMECWCSIAPLLLSLLNVLFLGKSKKSGKGKKAVVESSDEVEVDEIVEPTAKVKQVTIISL